jgi:DNA-binding FadR family transcriptional regulator
MTGAAVNPINEKHLRAARKPKVAERVARDIGDQILRDGLAEGDPLPNERVMAAQHGVGRTTLREALRILETHGVIRLKPGPGGGPYVRTPRPDDLVGAMTLVLQFLGSSLAEVTDARASIEPVVAGLAAARGDADDVAAMQATINTMRAALSDDEVFYRENDAFHARLAEACGNTVLLVVAETLERVTAGIDTEIDYPPRTRGRIADAHQRIVDAIALGDVAGAQQAAADHITEFRRYAERRFPGRLREPVRWDGAGA